MDLPKYWSSDMVAMMIFDDGDDDDDDDDDYDLNKYTWCI